MVFAVIPGAFAAAAKFFYRLGLCLFCKLWRFFLAREEWPSLIYGTFETDGAENLCVS